MVFLTSASLSLYPRAHRPGLFLEVADAIIVSSDRHAFTVGLNVTVLTGSVNVALKPAVPLDALLGGGRADTIESSACPPPAMGDVLLLLGRVLLCATLSGATGDGFVCFGSSYMSSKSVVGL